MDDVEVRDFCPTCKLVARAIRLEMDDHVGLECPDCGLRWRMQRCLSTGPMGYDEEVEVIAFQMQGRRESDTSTIPSEGAVWPQEPRNTEIGSLATTQAGDGQERADPSGT